MTPRRLACAALLLVACGENPAFESTAADGSAAPTAPAATTSATAAGTSTGAATDDGSAGQSADGSATTAATTTLAETTLAETTLVTTGVATGDASTGPACVPAPLGDCVDMPLDGHAYFRCPDTVAFAAADAACRERCAELVVLDVLETAQLTAALLSLFEPADAAQLQAIEDGQTTQAEATRASWWIGGSRQDGAWTWSDGTPMPGVGEGAWADGDPEQDPQAEQDCAALAVYGAGEQDGRWFDRSCDRTYRFVCERL